MTSNDTFLPFSFFFTTAAATAADVDDDDAATPTTTAFDVCIGAHTCIRVLIQTLLRDLFFCLEPG